MKHYILGAIFARGGSKGVPRKNIRPLNGKPLIAYSITAAKQCSLIDRVIVSTDDKEIAEIAQDWGAEVPFLRPKHLANDDTQEWLAWQHAIRELEKNDQFGKIDLFVSLPPTSPFRSIEDVEVCINKLVESEADIVITVKPAARNPYYNMVALDADGFARLILPADQLYFGRQSAPLVYDMTTVAYAAWSDYVLSASSIFDGKVKVVVVPPERALDIDTELDFDIAECLLNIGASHVV